MQLQIPTAVTLAILYSRAETCRYRDSPGELMCSYTRYPHLAAKPRPLPSPMYYPQKCKYKSYPAVQLGPSQLQAVSKCWGVQLGVDGTSDGISSVGNNVVSVADRMCCCM
jgi:hypothetical protein